MSSKPNLLRYWVTNDWETIRIEWTDAEGITRSASGYTVEGRRSLGWHYGTPSESLRDLARDCLADGYEHSVPGCEFVGEETDGEQDHQVADRCTTCGVVQVGQHDLSDEHGECGICHIGRLAKAAA